MYDKTAVLLLPPSLRKLLIDSLRLETWTWCWWGFKEKKVLVQKFSRRDLRPISCLVITRNIIKKWIAFGNQNFSEQLVNTAEMPIKFLGQTVQKHFHLGQSIKEWTKQNFLKAVFHKLYLVHSWILHFVPFDAPTPDT